MPGFDIAASTCFGQPNAPVQLVSRTRRTLMSTIQKILITGAGGAAAISFMKALRGESVEFYAADMDPYAAGLYLVPSERRLLLPPGTDATFAARLLEHCKTYAIDVLVPTVDAELLPIAERRNAFEAAGVQVLLASQSALELCLDKWMLFQACNGVLPVPRTALFDEHFDPYGWDMPLIVKPRRGSGSRGVVLVESHRDLDALTRSKALLVQEYLPGPEYSVDIMATGGGEVIAVVPRERLKVDSGVAVTARTVRHAVLEPLAKVIAVAFGLVYTANLQFRCDAEGKPILLEINPRFPGTMPLTVASGVNMPLLCLKELGGHPIRASECRFREMAMVRCWEEIMIPSEAITSLEQTTAADRLDPHGLVMTA